MAQPNTYTLQYGPLTSALAAQGRGGDSMLAHMTPGDQVVPPQVQTPQVRTALNRAFAAQGANAAQFRAGSPSSGTNPSTGLSEFQMSDDPNDPYGQQAQAAYAPPAAPSVSGVGMSTEELRNYHVPTVNMQAVMEARNPPLPAFDPQTWGAPQDIPNYGVSTPTAAPQSTGYMGIIGRGMLRAGEENLQSMQAVSGKTPTTSATPLADYEQPVTFSDLFSPSTLVDKTLYQFAKSSPTIAGSILGFGAGAAAGAAIPGAGETGTSEAVGGVAGMALGAGLTSAFQALGPLYAEELKQNPNNPDMAFDAALKRAGTEGVISGVAQAAFEWAPLKGIIKNVFLQAGLVQPGIAGVGAAAQGLEQGKSAGDIASDVAAALPGAVVGTAAGEAGFKGGKWLAGKWVPNTTENAPPIGDDQAAALQLALPPPSDINRPQLPAPPIYAGDQSGTAPPRMLPPPGGGVSGPTPPAGELPTIPLPQAGGAPTINVPPTGPEQQGAPPGLPPPGPENRPPSPPGAGNINVPPTGPEQVSPTLAAPARPVVGEVPLPTPPRGALPQMMEQAGRITGQEPPAPPETPPPPTGGGGGEPPPPPPPGAGGGGAEAAPPEPAAPVTTVATPTPEGFTVEPDHTGPPGAMVVKDANGNVIAVGDSAEQALQFARQRAPGVQLASAEGAPPGRGEAQPAATVEASKPAEQPPAPTSSPAPGALAAGEQQPLQRIPGQPQGFYRVRQEDDGTVHADIIDNQTGKQQSFFVADDGSIAKAGSDKTPWQAPNDAAQQRAAELLEQGVRRSTGVRTVEPKFPDKVTSALQKHVANFGEPSGSEMVASAKAGGPDVGTQLKARKAKQAQPAPKRGAVYTAEPTPEEEPPIPPPVMFSGMAGEAREEAEALTSGARLEPGTIPVKEPKGETTSKGAPTEAPAGVAELATAGLERSEQTSNKARYARDYLQAIASGEMTPEEAHAAYGEQPEGAGRPRQFPRFRDYVQNILDKMNAPGQSLTDRIAAVQKAFEAGELTGRKRSAAEREISRSDALKYTPEQLQKIIDRLPDPAEELRQAEEAMKAAFERDLDVQHEADETRPSPSGAASREANKPMVDLLDRLDRGEHLTSGNLIDAITNHSAPRILAPHLAAIVRRLRDFLPEIPVYSYEEGRRVLGLPDRPLGKNARGTYMSERAGIGQPEGKEAIFLNTSQEVRGREDFSPIATVAHELLHAATLHYVKALASSRRDVDFHNMRALEAIQAELRDVVNKVGGRADVSPYMIQKMMIASKDKAEAITYLMTDPNIQRLLAGIDASPTLKRTLAAHGFDPARTTSVWQAFKNFVAHVFGLSPNQSSVLDHIMDPLTSVVEAGAEYRRTIGRRYPGMETVPRYMGPETDVAHELNDTAFKSVTDPVAAGKTAGKLLRDFASRPAFKGVLNVANLDAIHSFGRRLFESKDPEAPGNSLTDFRAAREAQAATTKAERDQYGNFVQRMVARLRYGADGPKIAQLMNDATLANVRLGDRDPGANAHLRSDEQLTRLKQLQDRYEALGQQGQATYRELRDYYRETYNKERQAQFDHALQSWMPDATAAERQALYQQVRTRDGVEKLLDGKTADDTPLAQAFGERWQNKRAVAQELGRLQRAGQIRGDYFPLRRYGDYVVRYGERGDPRYGVEMFERESQAQARREELLSKEGYSEEEVSPVFLKSQLDRVRNLMGPSVDSLSAALDKSGVTGAAKERALDAYAEMQLRNETRTQSNMMRARREGVLGANTDQARNLANDFMAYSSRMGWLKNGAAQVNALDRMDRQLEWMRRHGEDYSSGEVQRAGMIRDEMRNRTTPGDNSSNVLGRAAQNLTSYSFIMNLMRPAHMLVQLADAHSNAESLIGARHGFGAAAVQLGKAVRDLGGTALATGGRNAMKAVKGELENSDWNVSQLYRNRLVERGMNPNHADRLINNLNAAGLIDHSQVREIQRMAGSGAWDFGTKYGSKVSELSAGMMNMFQAGEHAIDSMNRTAIAKAAFDLEMRKTNGDLGKAIDYAVQTARDAMPNYNLHNKPSIASRQGRLGRLMQPILQYKLYGLHMYSLMGNLAHKAMTEGGEGRREAVKALSAILGSHALLSGATASVFGALPVAVGLGLYDLFRGDDKPHTAADLENMVRNYVRDTAGRTASEVIARGIPTLAGVDLHRSLKLSNAVDLPEIKSFHSSDLLAALGSAALGASGQNLASTVDGLSTAFKGDIVKGLTQAVAPRPIHDLIQAYQFSQQGVTDTRGNQILASISAYDAVAKGLGFNPSDVASAREARQAEIEHRDETLAERSRALNAYVQASPADRGATMAMIWQYNRTHPAEPITIPQLKEALNERAKQAMTPGTYGLRVPKKQLREMQDAGRFAQP